MKQGRNLDADHCRELVRANDLACYLSSLLAAKEKHRALFAIYAFAGDVGKIAGQVSEPAIGEIRLQWWHDEIEAIFADRGTDNPIGKELQSVVRQYDLPKHLFTRYINARQFDIYRQPMASLSDLVKYQSDTATAITDMASRILIGYEALEIKTLIAKAGIACGLGEMLQTLPVQVARKQCFLPADMLLDRGTSVGDVLSGRSSMGVKLVVSQLCHQVTENLNQIRQEQGILKKPVLPAFFPASLAGLAVAKISSSSADPLQIFRPVSQLKMQLFLLKKSFLEQV